MQTRKRFLSICVSLFTARILVSCKSDEPEKDVKMHYSAWLRLPSGKKVDAIHWQYLIDIPELTQDIIDNGALLIYYNTCCGGSPIYQLPFTEGSFNLYYQIPDQISDDWKFALYSTKELMTAVDRYRYVILKGGALASARKAAIDYADYNTVKKAYTIPD